MSSPELLALRSAFAAMKQALADNDLSAIESSTMDFRVGLEQLNAKDDLGADDLSLVHELHEMSDAIAIDLASRLNAFDLVIAAWRDAERD
jgi:hypothetical protein